MLQQGDDVIGEDFSVGIRPVAHNMLASRPASEGAGKASRILYALHDPAFEQRRVLFGEEHDD